MPRAVLRIIAFCVAFCVGCGGRTDTEGSSRGGSGGAAGAGGMGAGGAAGSGGTIGAAGVMSSGGTTGLAGTTASGGASGASGAGESGGNGGAAAGGMSGAGGSIGGAGGRGGGSGGRGGTTGFAGRGGASGGGGGSGGAGTAGSDGGAGGVGGAPMMSAGCGKTPTLKNSPSASTFTYNTISSGGTQRQYILRWPTDYDSTHPYRLIIGLHGATGKGSDVARSPAYFGLFDLSQGSTIFIAPDAAGGLWSAAPDTTFVDDILEKVEADLCIDLTRIELEGFSQGAAMAWTLACSRPGVFRAVVGHSGGGVANPTSCQPIAYMGSLGLQENGGQNTQTDQFAKFNACTITTLPRAPSGGHVCTDYTGCPTARPVRWCSYDGGHTPSPTDSGQSTSWMPREVWSFLTRF